MGIGEQDCGKWPRGIWEISVPFPTLGFVKLEVLYKQKSVKNAGNIIIQISSVLFSCSVVSNSLWPREPQHARPPCPSPTPGVHPNLCPLSQWCHPTISSSAIPFSYPQSFPASGSFLMSQLFTSGDQSFGVSASTSVLPMNTHDWSPLGWTGWISLQSKGLSSLLQFKYSMENYANEVEISLRKKHYRIQVFEWKSHRLTLSLCSGTEVCTAV